MNVDMDVKMEIKMEDAKMEVDNINNEELGSKTDKSIKRKHDENDQDKQKKRNENRENRKRRKLGTSTPKTPLMHLNELRPGLRYIVEKQEGPPHEPIFVISVEINNGKFTGKGPSKQLAKHAAAQAALQSFVQFHDMSEANKISSKNIESWDFTTDSFESVQKKELPLLEINRDTLGKDKPKKSVDIIEDFRSKNPIVMLNEHFSTEKIEFTLLKENQNIPGQRFTMSVQVKGKTFEGSGPSKKLAKAAAARSALCNLFNINYNLSLVSNLDTIDYGNDLSQFPQTCADRIARAIYDKFAEIMEGNQEQAKWKVLAGIAMTTNPDMDNVTVVGVSTGTKCINGEHMSMDGQTLNDCHAEIISRRCLKNFLYMQLEEIKNNESNQTTIFIKNKNGKFSLKPDVKFHLFISTSPCGDARIFSPHDESIDKHPNRKARGLLRTKIESGEGTIPVKKSNTIQTWDGIIHGQQRLLTMSCSDKLASWNVFGLQGALLNHFIEPIYLESIILGSLFHPNHMIRAMWKRFENVGKNLIPPFHLNRPKLCCTTSLEGRHTVKSPNFSSNWSIGRSEKAEIVNATTGKTYEGLISSIAKRAFFIKFLNLYDHFYSPKSRSFKLYSEAKAVATEYQKAKETLKEAFEKSTLGIWVKKPMEQEQFEIN